MVTTLHNFWQKHQKAILIGATVGIAVLAMPHLAHAAPEAAKSDTGICANTLSGMSQMLDVLQMIFWPVLLMIGSLMQNDLLFGAGMEQKILDVWVNIRNIVNILFVLVLLGIALYNVVGGPGDNYHLKAILPKFILGLIAVNFTFIGIKVVLDAVNITSTAIFALPNTVEQSLQKTLDKDGKPVAMAGMLTVEQANSFCAITNGAKTPGDTAYFKNLNKDPKNRLCSDKKDAQGNWMEQKTVETFSNLNSNNAAMVMALALGKANLLNKVYVKTNDATCAKLVSNTILSMVIYIIYGTAFIALFITLLIRLVVLWVVIAISPLMVLPLVLPESIKSKLGEAGDITKKFVANAIVPIPVALVMSIGYIMLTALETVDFSKSDSILNKPTLDLNFLSSGLTTLQDLLIGFGMVAFVWIGVFEAMKGTFADSVTNSLKGMVEGAGKKIGGFAVGSIPLFPTGRMDKNTGKPLWGNIKDIGLGMRGLNTKLDSAGIDHASQVFPNLVGNTTEALRNIGNARNVGDLRKAGATSEAWLQGQKNLASAMKATPALKTEIKRELVAKDFTAEEADKFIKDLDLGQVPADTMHKAARALGIQYGEEPKAKDAPKSAEAGSLIKNAEKDEKDGLLEPGGAKKVSALETTRKTSKTQKERDDAQKALDDIAKAVEAKKTARDDIIAQAKYNVGSTSSNPEALSKELADRIKELEGKGVKNAKEQIMKAAVDALKADKDLIAALNAADKKPEGLALEAINEAEKTTGKVAPKKAAPKAATPPTPPATPPPVVAGKGPAQ